MKRGPKRRTGPPARKVASKRALWRLQAEGLRREQEAEESRRESEALARAHGARL